MLSANEMLQTGLILVLALENNVFERRCECRPMTDVDRHRRARVEIHVTICCDYMDVTTGSLSDHSMCS